MKSQINLIRERMKKILFSDYYSAEKREDTYLGELLENGSFADVDYRDQGRAAWSAASHYNRIKMELILGGEARICTDTAWRERIYASLAFWIQNDPICPNWWFNVIDMPRAFAFAALMLDTHLPENMHGKFDELIARGTCGTGYTANATDEELCTVKKPFTGANLIWCAVIAFMHALWREDERMLHFSIACMAEELDYHYEGIQPDGAFCQHGQRLYSGGYGRAFVYELAPIFHCVSGTDYDFPPEKMDIFLYHVLDGQRVMQKNGYFDYRATGREYARPDWVRARSLVRAVRMLTECEKIPRKEELTDFLRELEGTPVHFEITRYYPSVALLVHRKNGRYIAVQGRTNEVLGAEICNDENVLAYNMSYGTTTVCMHRGDEYATMSAVWDFSKIPGTTAREESEETLYAKDRAWSKNAESPCRADGKSEGDYGLMWQDAVHDGISLKAAYFVFNGALIALGTDLHDDTPEKGALITTVEQCLALSPSINAESVKNGGFCYHGLGGCKLSASVEKREGDWARNNRKRNQEIFAEEDVFCVTLPAREDGKYAYMIAPDGAVPQVEVLANNARCQAICVDGNRLMAVFREAGTLTVGARRFGGAVGEMLILPL